MGWEKLVFETMGTVVSINAKSSNLSGDIGSGIQEVFQSYDERYSLYKPGSELSLLNSGELKSNETSEELRAVLAEAYEWRNNTGGAFAPNRPDGFLDLNGIVKAKALAAAEAFMKTNDVDSFSINCGGDVITAGVDNLDQPWAIGVSDPEDRNKLLASVLLLTDYKAIATSGMAEKGNHIWLANGVEQWLTQATVVASDIVTADVLATAIIASSKDQADEIVAHFDVELLAVTNTGELFVTERLRKQFSD